MNISGETEIRGVDNLVCRGVGQDSFSMDTSLVGKCAESGDVVVEWDVDFDCFGNEVLKVSELMQLVLGHDIFPVGNNHASHETSEGGDSISLTNAEDGGINVGCTSFESAVRVGDGTTGIVVEMGLDVAGDDAAEGADKVVNLAGGCTADSVRDTL